METRFDEVGLPAEMPGVDPLTLDPAVLEGYGYDELNRDHGALYADFGVLDGEGPLVELVECYKRQGHVTVLDAGCGTGNQLHGLIDQAERRGVDSEHVFADGLSDFDFSGVSNNGDTLQAIEVGRINYAVADLGTEQLPADAYDLIYSYEVLFHNEKPAPIVLNLWQALRGAGSLYFNVPGEQIEDIAPTVEAIAAQGGIVQSAACEVPERIRRKCATSGAPLPTRYVYKITKAQ